MKAVPVVIVLIAAAAAGYFLRRWLLLRQIPAPRRPRAPAAQAGGSVPAASSEPLPSQAAVPAGGDLEKDITERRSDPDPQALAKTAVDPSRIGFDLERISKLSGDYQPVEEFLRYIQVQRGEGASSLVFVRRRDLDSMGALMGMSKEGFVNEFEKLGVMISLN